MAKLLRQHGYGLQAPNKSVEGAQHPDRNAPFEPLWAWQRSVSLRVGLDALALEAPRIMLIDFDQLQKAIEKRA